MTLDIFAALISSAPAPVILIEGRRSVPDDAAHLARRASCMLATRFPALRFRSGNATCADQAFAAGVIDVAPERLEIIASYASHRARDHLPLVRYESPEALDPMELKLWSSKSIGRTGLFDARIAENPANPLIATHSARFPFQSPRPFIFLTGQTGK